MPTFAATDGTKLAYLVRGEGAPMICLPGGPMQDSAYLGDLGGMSDRTRLILLDPRGTGRSAIPADPASYRCDRQVGDVEALRVDLGVARVDVLGHSAGANLAVQYAVRYPKRVDRLVLVTPSPFAVGISVDVETRRDVVRRRAGEPWFASASAAFDRIAAGGASDGDGEAVAPLFYGRWDAAARDHHAMSEQRRNTEAAREFGSDGAFDPSSTRAALSTLDVPVLLIAGALDLNSPPPAVAEYADLFPDATLRTQPGAGHFPWLDDPAGFAAILGPFLAGVHDR